MEPRKAFTATEVYNIGKGLKTPVSRSVLSLYRKTGKYTPVAKVLGHFIYSREQVIDLLKFLSTYRNKAISEATVIEYLDDNYSFENFMDRFLS